MDPSTDDQRPPPGSSLKLYHSPQGLYPFQAEGVAWGVLRHANLCVWDTGLGKSHLAMASAAICFEDDLIDLCVVVCEQNKLGEWPEDFERFTGLTVGKYHGPRRKKLLDDPPQVMVTTYETMRNDVGIKDGPRKIAPGPMLGWLSGKRVLVVYDEMVAKLGASRGSSNYKHHQFMLNELRKVGDVRVLSLTATPVDRDPESTFNMIRLIYPGFCTVNQFENDHVVYRDIYGKARKFKNLDFAEDHGVVPLREKIAPILLVKRKTDPDVVDQFPKQVEEFTYTPLGDKHQDFYDAIVKEYASQASTPFEEAGIFTVLRQIAAHPMSLLRSHGETAQDIVRQVGVEGLEALGSTKTDRLMEYLSLVVDSQGSKAVVFTFFGQSVLPILAERIRAAGISVVVNHGAMSSTQREEAKAEFRFGEAQVFLSSDAGARGLNLPEGLYVVNYELPLTHANYIQRINRIHRIDSPHPSVTCQSLITPHTIEEGIAKLVQRGNEWNDTLLGDEDEGGEMMSAADRRRLMRIARTNLKDVDA